MLFREINLDVGAQAIQASAAACVQNVIRGLKTNRSDEDKVSILPDVRFFNLFFSGKIEE